MKKQLYDTVIFDIGNVLMQFNWMGYVQPMWEPEIAGRITEAIFGDGRWDEMDRGIKSETEILQSFIDADPKLETEIRYTYDNCLDSLHRLNYAADWIREVKDSGRQALYLSNYSRLLVDGKPEVLDFLSEMDGGVFSYLVGAIKPEPEIYQILIDKYRLIPEKCIFIDDREANLASARNLGFQTILFDGYEQCRAKLNELLL